jgi:predicted RNase H-like nuclease (RuvC/YqgF family)
MRKNIDDILTVRTEAVSSVVDAYSKLSVPKWIPSRSELEKICSIMRKVLDQEHAILEEIADLNEQNANLQLALKKANEKVKMLHEALHDPNRDSPWT